MNELRIKQRLSSECYQRILRFFGHITRRQGDNLEKLVVQGKVEGTRSRGPGGGGAIGPETGTTDSECLRPRTKCSVMSSGRMMMNVSRLMENIVEGGIVAGVSSNVVLIWNWILGKLGVPSFLKIPLTSRNLWKSNLRFYVSCGHGALMFSSWLFFLPKVNAQRLSFTFWEA